METPIEVDVRHGTRLEALLALPESPRAGLVVCHPHPLYGGDMHNPVVVRASEVAQGLGLATLRFNFRGVGASTGVHDEGKGEQDDVLAALDMLAARLPAGRQVGLAGYSFGSWVSARVVAAGRDLPEQRGEVGRGENFRECGHEPNDTPGASSGQAAARGTRLAQSSITVDWPYEGMSNAWKSRLPARRLRG